MYMKGLKNKIEYFYRRHTLLIKILLSYFVTGFLILTIFSFVILRTYNKRSIEEINQTSENMITQSYYTADILLSNTYYNYYQLFANNTDQDITNALYAKELDDFDVIDTQKKLGQYAMTNPLVHSIYIYNSDANKVIYQLVNEYVGVQTPVEFFDKDIMHRIESKDKAILNTYFTRKLDFELGNNKASDNLITLVFANTTVGNVIESAIIVNLKQSVLQQMVSNGKAGDLNQVFIIYQNGDVITHSDTSMINKNLGGESYIKTIFQSGNQKGHFTCNIDGKNSLVTYVKADRLRWIFVGIGEYDKLLSSVASMQKTILLLTILFIFMAMIVAAFFASSIYNPFQNLLKDIQKRINNNKKNTSLDVYDYLKYTFHELADYVDKYKVDSYELLNEKKRLLLLKLLDGEIGDELLETKYMDEYGIDFKYLSFQVVVIKIDSYETEIIERLLYDPNLIKFAILNIACELLKSEQIQVEAIDNGEDFVSVILNIKNYDSRIFSLISDDLRKVQDNVQLYLKCTVTIGIGDINEGINGIHDSFDNAVAASNYRIVFGQNSIINYNDIEMRNLRTNDYPSNLEKQVVDSLKGLNMKKLDISLKDFFDSLILYNDDEILMYVTQFLVALTKTISSITKISDDNGEYSFKILFSKVQAYETLEDIKAYLHTLCYNVIEIASSGPEKNRKIIVAEKIKEYVDKYYSDSNISSDAVADYVKLSSSYVRSIFKEIIGISLSEYITQCRISEAERLLTHTDYPVRKVAELIGFPENSKYFYTVFKKNFGKTPEDYRNKIKALTDNSNVSSERDEN